MLVKARVGFIEAGPAGSDDGAVASGALGWAGPHPARYEARACSPRGAPRLGPGRLWRVGAARPGPWGRVRGGARGGDDRARSGPARQGSCAGAAAGQGPRGRV